MNQPKIIVVPHELIYGKIVAGFRTLHISAVLESAADAKYYSDLIEDHHGDRKFFWAVL